MGSRSIIFFAALCFAHTGCTPWTSRTHLASDFASEEAKLENLGEAFLVSPTWSEKAVPAQVPSASAEGTPHLEPFGTLALGGTSRYDVALQSMQSCDQPHRRALPWMSEALAQRMAASEKQVWEPWQFSAATRQEREESQEGEGSFTEGLLKRGEGPRHLHWKNTMGAVHATDPSPSTPSGNHTWRGTATSCTTISTESPTSSNGKYQRGIDAGRIENFVAPPWSPSRELCLPSRASASASGVGDERERSCSSTLLQPSQPPQRSCNHNSRPS